MDGRYILGISAAILSGALFNIGTLMQKLAVMERESDAGLMKKLVRSPKWIAGFLIQLALGSPLNLLAFGLIGPVIVPGLSSIGLVVLALGAAKYAKERFRATEIAGIVLVMAAVTLFGLGRMSVDLRAAGMYETAFLARLGWFSVVLGVLCVGCYLAQKRRPQWAGVLRTLDAGLLLSICNLWLGVMTVILVDWAQAQFALRLLPFVMLGSAVTGMTGMLAIAETQRAFAVGEASKLIPIQYVPSQIVPVLAYYLVFRLRPQNALTLPLTLCAVACVLLGAFLLAGRQMAQQTKQVDSLT